MNRLLLGVLLAGLVGYTSAQAAPQVFDGIEIGKTTLKSYIERRSETCPVRLIDDETARVSPRCLGLPVRGVTLKAKNLNAPIGLIVLDLPEDVFHERFESIARELIERWGKPIEAPVQLGDRRLIWEKKDVIIELNSVFMNFSAGQLIYASPDYVKDQSKKADGSRPKAEPRRQPQPAPETPQPERTKPKLPQGGILL